MMQLPGFLPDESRPMAMVAVARKRPNFVSLEKCLAELLVDEANLFEVNWTDFEETRTFVVTVGRWSVLGFAVPFPIPDETLADAIADELAWRDALSAFKRSKSHVLLSIMNSERDHVSHVDQLRLLTVVANAVSRSANGLGIFWVGSQSVVSPDDLNSDTRIMLVGDQLPECWFSVRFFPGPEFEQDKKIVCQSRGLAPLLGRELECGPYNMLPAKLGEIVLGTTRFMAREGPIFGDGHTFSFSGGTKPDAQLQYRWSPLGGVNRQVFGLVLAADLN